MKKIGFLQEDYNVNSITRLCFFLIIVVSLVLTSFLVFTGNPISAISVYVSMTTVATGLKLIQKGQEVKSSSENKEEEIQQ